MTSFRLALFGYRRAEVDAAVTARDSHIAGLEQHSAALVEHNQSLEAQGLIQARAIASHEADVSSLSGMVIERERTIRDLTERLEEANACHDRSIASLDAVSARLEELQAQARGQATRIRMKALREAVELSSKAQALAEVEGAQAEATEPPTRDAAEPEIAAEVAAVEEAAAEADAPAEAEAATSEPEAPAEAPVAESNDSESGSEDDGDAGEAQEGESVADRPDSPDSADEAASGDSDSESSES